MYILSQDLFRLRTRSYMDTFFPMAKSLSGHTCAHMFTDGEGYVWIMHFFSKAEVGMELRAFARQVGISNKLNFDRAADKMGRNNDFQCATRKFRIEWINSEPFSSW